MNQLAESIESFQQSVFEYRLDDIAKDFVKLIDALSFLVDNIAHEYRNYLNQILEAMLSAYERKDFLLVADLAEYELKTLAVQAKNME